MREMTATRETIVRLRETTMTAINLVAMIEGTGMKNTGTGIGNLDNVGMTIIGSGTIGHIHIANTITISIIATMALIIISITSVITTIATIIQGMEQSIVSFIGHLIDSGTTIAIIITMEVITTGIVTMLVM